MKYEWVRYHSGKWLLVDKTSVSVATKYYPVYATVKRSRIQRKMKIFARFGYSHLVKTGFQTIDEAKDWVMAQIVAELLEDEG